MCAPFVSLLFFYLRIQVAWLEDGNHYGIKHVHNKHCPLNFTTAKYFELMFTLCIYL